MNKDISDTKSTNKILHILIIALLPLLLVAGIFIYGSHGLVFADNHTVGSSNNLRAMIYGTDLELERSSRRPKVVSIKKGDNVYSVLTVDTTIKDIFKKYHITMEGGEKVIISTEYMTNGSLVRVIKTETVIEENILEIPFETETVKSNMYLKGEQNIVQEGVLGIRKQRVLNYYEDGELIMSRIIEDNLKQEPVKRIVEIGTSIYSLIGIDPKGYNCPYWYSVVDDGPYNEEEKRWLKFIMHCESGCNAESNKSSYKGLFQWSPYWWSRQFKENIFDGHAQLKNTISKYRAGESTRKSQWPACHSRYVRIHGTN